MLERALNVTPANGSVMNSSQSASPLCRGHPFANLICYNNLGGLNLVTKLLIIAAKVMDIFDEVLEPIQIFLDLTQSTL